MKSDLEIRAYRDDLAVIVNRYGGVYPSLAMGVVRAELSTLSWVLGENDEHDREIEEAAKAARM